MNSSLHCLCAVSHCTQPLTKQFRRKEIANREKKWYERRRDERTQDIHMGEDRKKVSSKGEMERDAGRCGRESTGKEKKGSGERKFSRVQALYIMKDES